jgi:hypothetical protein
MASLFPGSSGPVGGGGGAPAEPQDDGKIVSLNGKIMKTGCYARNESSGFPMSNLFIGDSRLGCKSDADEQLILHIEFDEFVKVSGSARVLKSECSYSTFEIRFDRSNSQSLTAAWTLNRTRVRFICL